MVNSVAAPAAALRAWHSLPWNCGYRTSLSLVCLLGRSSYFSVPYLIRQSVEVDWFALLRRERSLSYMHGFGCQVFLGTGIDGFTRSSFLFLYNHQLWPQGLVGVLGSISAGGNNSFPSSVPSNFFRFWAPYLPDQCNISPTVSLVAYPWLLCWILWQLGEGLGWISH